MNLNKGWMRRRWWEGRTGHTTYLMFILTIANFLLIAYRFLIEQNSLFESLMSNLWTFALFFVISYIPISILIGHWHRETQQKVELSIKLLENPINAKMFRTMLDVQTGKASDEEIGEFREFLKKIESKNY